jgi:hypothetical protein
MSDFFEDNISPEDKYTALVQYWDRHNKLFNIWWLNLNSNNQKQILLKAIPDIPENPNNSSNDINVKFTDIILPELTLQGLLTGNGKLLSLFLARRLVTKDNCYAFDVNLLKELHMNDKLPSISGNQLDGVDTPFIDPTDINENIQALGKETSDEKRLEIQTLLQMGRLIHADVWLALKLRRSSIVALIVALVEEHQLQATKAKDKPSPTYSSLLAGELSQKKFIKDDENDK